MKTSHESVARFGTSAFGIDVVRALVQVDDQNRIDIDPWWALIPDRYRDPVSWSVARASCQFGLNRRPPDQPIVLDDFLRCILDAIWLDLETVCMPHGVRYCEVCLVDEAQTSADRLRRSRLEVKRERREEFVLPWEAGGESGE
jgi:hypothetical protein